MKKLTVIILIVTLLAVLVCFTGAAGEKETAVILDGDKLGAGALLAGTTAYLPFRAACEALGYTVSWSVISGAVTVIAEKDGDSVSINVTDMTITDNGHLYNAAVYSGKGVLLLSGRTYMDSGLFSTVFSVSASYDSKSGQIKLQRRAESGVTVVNESVQSQTEYLSTTIQYPQLGGLTDESVQSAINTCLKQAAMDAQAEGEVNASDMAQAVKDGFTGAVGRCETYFDYMIEYNQNGLVSIVLQDYQYAGGAHGTTVQRAFTFDLAAGKELKLGDLTGEGSSAAAFIDRAIRQVIDARVAAGELSEFDFSPFKDIGTDPGFYLSGDGIVFFFREYEYFPYAAGIQEFNVKYSALAPMLSSAYRFLGDAPVTLSPSAQNMLSVGDIARVVQDGNPTTGYTWQYSISGDGVLALVSDDYTPSGSPGAAGAGGNYGWSFKALKSGKATITYKYYRVWEGESSATPDHTVVYQVTVI